MKETLLLLAFCVLLLNDVFAQTLDPAFHSAVPVRRAQVNSILVQPDGK